MPGAGPSSATPRSSLRDRLEPKPKVDPDRGGVRSNDKGGTLAPWDIPPPPKKKRGSRLDVVDAIPTYNPEAGNMKRVRRGNRGGKWVQVKDLPDKGYGASQAVAWAGILQHATQAQAPSPAHWAALQSITGAGVAGLSASERAEWVTTPSQIAEAADVSVSESGNGDSMHVDTTEVEEGEIHSGARWSVDGEEDNGRMGPHIISDP
ncbi:hypothetical protein C8R45DRAFT_1096659 [Mycena sanguinolenta]|nr:hypothetical protein C8R45DRAFT_1096659 [Mycena sanguinolenta]